MAAVVVITIVLLPLALLLGDLVRPSKKDRPVAFAGPPSGKERPVPMRIDIPMGVDPIVAAGAARDEARRSAVRAPIAAASHSLPEAFPGVATPKLRAVTPVDAVHEAFAGSVARRSDAA